MKNLVKKLTTIGLLGGAATLLILYIDSRRQSLNPPQVWIESRYGADLGLSTVLEMGAIDEGKNAGIIRSWLYEDNRLLRYEDRRPRNPTEIGKTFPLQNQPRGERIYVFEVEDRDGNRARQETRLNFSGTIEDMIPNIVDFSTVGDAGANGEALFNFIVTDEKDKAGIKKITLIENEIPVMEYTTEDFGTNQDHIASSFYISEHTPGMFSLSIEVMDEGGNRVRSNPITVTYETYPSS